MVYIDDGLRKWIAKTSVQQYWRVAGWMDVEDLIQDGLMCAVKCANKYECGQKDNPTKEDRRHFMALVMTSFMNHIHTLAAKRAPEVPEASLVSAKGESVSLEEIAPSEAASAPFMHALNTAPEHLARLIQLLVLDEDGMFVRERLGSRRLRETTEEHCRRLLGLSDDVNVLDELREHFSIG